MKRTAGSGALHELAVRCRVLAERYEHLVKRSDGALKRQLDQLAERRRAESEQLETVIRQLGERPDAPDPEREVLALLWRRATAMVSHHGMAAELHALHRDEQQLAAVVAASRAEPFPPDVQDLLADLEQHALASSRTLSELAEHRR